MATSETNYEEDAGMEVELTVDAPREDVFDVIADTGRWKELVTCITGGEVLTDHSVGEGVQLRWEVTLAGFSVHVREMIDGYDRPNKFTWTSVEESNWNHEGAVRFEEIDENRTRVYTYMDYDLPSLVDNRVTRPLFKRQFQSEIAKSFGQVGEMVEAENAESED